MKDPKKVEVGKRLAEYEHRKRKECAQLAKAQSELTCYGAGGIVATGALGILGYHIYQSKKTSKETPFHQINENYSSSIRCNSTSQV